MCSCVRWMQLYYSYRDAFLSLKIAPFLFYAKKDCIFAQLTNRENYGTTFG